VSVRDDILDLASMYTVIEELKEELKKADGGKLRPADEVDIEEIRKFGFPQVLISFYRESAPDPIDGRIELDQRIWSIKNAVIENRDYVPGADLFPLGFVVFASNKFGDAYCMDTVNVDASGEYPVMLFPHDVIEEGFSLKDVERYRLQVASNLQDFLVKFTKRTLINEPKYS
jgi:hypothetical protein